MIDLVDLDHISLFVDTDDLIYSFISEERKHYTQEQHLLNAAKSLQTNLKEPQGEITGENVVQLILEHYWSNALPFSYFDIGCQYGYSTINVAGYIKLKGNHNHVTCFEPGWSSRFTWPNIILNGLHDRITFMHQAVSCENGLATIFHDKGHSENDRLIMPQVQSQEITVETVSLDSYVKRHRIEGPVIVKIDIQGGEPLVFDGMKELMNSRNIVVIFEFTPHAIFSHRRPIAFLQDISQSSTLIAFDNIFGFPGQRSHGPGKLIRYDEIGSFVREIIAPGNHQPWRDIILIPWKLPKADILVKQIVGCCQ